MPRQPNAVSIGQSPAAQKTPKMDTIFNKAETPDEKRKRLIAEFHVLKQSHESSAQFQSIFEQHAEATSRQIDLLQQKVASLERKNADLQTVLEVGKGSGQNEEEKNKNIQSCIESIYNFVKKNFEEMPACWQTAQRNLLVHAVKQSFSCRLHPSTVYEPSLPYDLVSGAIKNSSDLPFDAVGSVLAGALVLPVRVFNAETLLPLSNNARDVSPYGPGIASGDKYGRFWCSECRTDRSMCKPTGHWGIRMGCDVETPFIFIYRMFKCKCLLRSIDTEDGGNGNFFNHFLEKACPEYVRRLCPVILTSKVCFTPRLRDHLREAAVSRSNTNEQSKIIQRFYGDSHLRRVCDLLSFIQRQKEDASEYYTYRTNHAQNSSQNIRFAMGQQFPHPIKWEGWTRELFGNDGNASPGTTGLPSNWIAESKMVKSPINAPSDEFFRQTVLKPHLDELRPICERFMDRIERTPIISLDATYYTSGQIHQKTGGGVAYRSSAAVMNSHKQIISFNFMLNDSMMCLSPILQRSEPSDPRIKQFTIYTDRCCMDGNFIDDMFGGRCNLRLDPWHWLSRFYYNNVLPRTNVTDKPFHDLIMQDIRRVLLHPQNDGSDRVFIRGPDVLKLEFDLLYARWLKNDTLKRIVTTDKFLDRWKKQMVHVERGCLSDPAPLSEMYSVRYVDTARPKDSDKTQAVAQRPVYHARRGTNVNENLHKLINAVIPSAGRMSQEFCAVLLALFSYRHNYAQSVMWVRGERKEIPHSDPILFLHTASLFRTTLGFSYQDFASNPLWTAFHGDLIGSSPASLHPVHPYFDSVESAAPAQPEISTSSEIPIAGWLDETSYSNMLFRALKKFKSPESSLPLSPRCVKGLDNPSAALGAFTHQYDFPRIQFPSVAVTVDFQEHLTKCLPEVSAAVAPLLSAVPNDDVCAFSSTENLFTALARVASTDTFPKPVAEQYDPLLDSRAIDEYDASLWSGIIDKELSSKDNLPPSLQQTISYRRVKLSYILQRAADVLNVVVALIRVGRVADKVNNVRMPASHPASALGVDSDLPFFVPREVGLVQDRTTPRKLVLCSIGIASNYDNFIVKVIGAIDVVFDKLNSKTKIRAKIPVGEDAAAIPNRVQLPKPKINNNNNGNGVNVDAAVISAPRQVPVAPTSAGIRQRTNDDPATSNNNAPVPPAPSADHQQQQQLPRTLQHVRPASSPSTRSTHKARPPAPDTLITAVDKDRFVDNFKVQKLAAEKDITKGADGRDLKGQLRVDRANELLKTIGWEFPPNTPHPRALTWFEDAKRNYLIKQAVAEARKAQQKLIPRLKHELGGK